MTKVSIRWVARLLITDPKCTKLIASLENLTDPVCFLSQDDKSQKQIDNPCSWNILLYLLQRSFIWSEDDGFRFLVCKRHSIYWLSSKVTLHQWRKTTPTCWGYEAETSKKTDQRVFASSGQLSGTKILAFHCCWASLRIWFYWASPYSPDLDPSNYHLLTWNQKHSDDVISTAGDFVDQRACQQWDPRTATPIEDVCGPQGGYAEK